MAGQPIPLSSLEEAGPPGSQAASDQFRKISVTQLPRGLAFTPVLTVKGELLDLGSYSTPRYAQGCGC